MSQTAASNWPHNRDLHIQHPCVSDKPPELLLQEYFCNQKIPDPPHGNSLPCLSSSRGHLTAGRCRNWLKWSNAHIWRHLAHWDGIHSRINSGFLWTGQMADSVYGVYSGIWLTFDGWVGRVSTHLVDSSVAWQIYNTFVFTLQGWASRNTNHASCLFANIDGIMALLRAAHTSQPTLSNVTAKTSCHTALDESNRN